MKSYSQSGQDLFVYNLMKGKPGTFLDLGCSLPKKINNTNLLILIIYVEVFVLCSQTHFQDMHHVLL